MPGSVNKAIIVGNLGADPDINQTRDGRLVVNMSVATSESWRDKNTGERRERTEWHRVVIFSEGLAKVAEQYLKKGAKVYVEGQIQTRKWQGSDGIERYSTEIVLNGFGASLQMLDRTGSTGYAANRAESPDDYGPSRTSDYGQQSGASDSGGSSGFSRALDDDIPF